MDAVDWIGGEGRGWEAGLGVGSGKGS